jgi:hypothetical protein
MRQSRSLSLLVRLVSGSVALLGVVLLATWGH